MIKQEELSKIPDLKTKAINYVFENGLNGTDTSNSQYPSSFDYGRTTNVSPAHENVAVRILHNPSYKF